VIRGFLEAGTTQVAAQAHWRGPAAIIARSEGHPVQHPGPSVPGHSGRATILAILASNSLRVVGLGHHVHVLTQERADCQAVFSA
jgi:hypothetical protein